MRTPSQTIGPYWHLIEDPAWADLTRDGGAGDGGAGDGGAGEVIVLTGTIVDGVGAPAGDACVELWQAVPGGGDGFGRARTDATGTFRFRTYAAPVITLTLFARGLLTHLHTRAFFEDGAAAAAHPGVPPGRRATLLARPDGTEGNVPVWRFDIRLRGEGETVFFELVEPPDRG